MSKLLTFPGGRFAEAVAGRDTSGGDRRGSHVALAVRIDPDARVKPCHDYDDPLVGQTEKDV